MSQGAESRFFHEVACAPSERAIAALLMNEGPQLTGVSAVGYYSFDTAGAGTQEVHVRGVSDAALDAYEREGRDVDPLHAYVSTHHVAGLMDFDELARAPGFATYVKRHQVDVTTMRQYLLAPIVRQGVAGMMHFAAVGKRRFLPGALRFAMGATVHVSARLAVLRALDSIDAQWQDALSRREREVAELAARGLTTMGIARAAGVSPNTIKKYMKVLYVKLHVSSRAELGATLMRGPYMLAREPHLPARSALPSGVTTFRYAAPINSGPIRRDGPRRTARTTDTPA